MKNTRKKVATIITMMFAIMTMTTRVYADMTLPPAALPIKTPVKSSGISASWPFLLILAVCVIGVIALIALRKKK